MRLMVENSRRILSAEVQGKIIEALISGDQRTQLSKRAERDKALIYIDGVGIQLFSDEVTKFCQQAALIQGYRRGIKKR